MQFKSFFDLDHRLEDIDRMGDPLAALDQVVAWEKFRPLLRRIHDKERKSNAGRRPYDSQVVGELVDLTIRTIGLMRAKVKIGLRNLAYNMSRLKTLLKPPKRSVSGGS